MAVQTMNGKFVIKSVQFPSYALNVYSNSGVSSGMNVCLFPYSSTDLLQQWVPQAQGNNVYKISTAYPNSCTVVLDRLRTTPVNNCDMFTSGASGDEGQITADLLDQQLQFDKGTDGYYTIYLYNNGQKDKVLTCASTVDNLGVGTVTSDLNVKDNVYWAAKSSSLGNRQKWKIEQLAFNASAANTILSHAQAYVQRDPTWAYLTDPTEFDKWACGICAITTCKAIMLSDNAFTPATLQAEGGFEHGNVEAYWWKFDMGDATDSDGKLITKAGFAKEVYSQISAGKPTVLHVKNGGDGHFVTAYGYTAGTTADNITPSRILIIDSYNPERVTLQNLLDNCPASGGWDRVITYQG